MLSKLKKTRVALVKGLKSMQNFYIILQFLLFKTETNKKNYLTILGTFLYDFDIVTFCESKGGFMTLSIIGILFVGCFLYWALKNTMSEVRGYVLCMLLLVYGFFLFEILSVINDCQLISDNLNKVVDLIIDEEPPCISKVAYQEIVPPGKPWDYYLVRGLATATLGLWFPATIPLVGGVILGAGGMITKLLFKGSDTDSTSRRRALLRDSG
jgi:hypothetical protein